MKRVIPALSLIILAFSVIAAPLRATAQMEHQLIRRLVVFPMVTPKDYEQVADEAWWQARDELAKSHRFLVASKQFLIKNDVYQPRTQLEPADAIILGKLLDAHALLTLELKDRRLYLTVYDGGNGLPLWKKSIGLHPSITVEDQLPQLTRRLIDAFMASIPYQGFTIVDSLIGTAVYEDGDVKLAQVDLGVGTGAITGDIVQWIKVEGTGTAPLFDEGHKITAIAEGKIVKLEQGVATVEILRASSLPDVKEYSLVRVPREAERLKTEYALRETPRATLSAEMVTPESNPMQQVNKERRPLLTTLSFIGSIAAFLLIAF